MTANDAARLIDISAVRTAHSLLDIQEVTSVAKKYNFINVHALPCWTKDVHTLLKDTPEIYVGAPVGFPSGAHKTCTKVLEAKELIADGVEEMDIVMNVGKFKNKEYDYVLNELNEIIALAPDYVLTKVIIELNCLNDEELDKACELVLQTKADFLKTGTGWVPGDANIARIARIKELTHGKIKVKAAGGIRTRKEFEQLCELGVERFGINTKSALEIVESFS
jgi:deoxyribose-phosphate aldolase